MLTTWKPKRFEEGWIVVDSQLEAAEFDATVHPLTSEGRLACRAEADRTNAEHRAWNRAGLADAPHMDAR